MVTQKMKSLVVAVLVLGLGIGAAVLPLRGPGGSFVATPTAHADEKKDKVETGPTVTGRVTALDTNKNTITLIMVTDPTKKEQTETTYSLPNEVKVILHHGLLKETKAGKIDDVKVDSEVSAVLSVDKKSVVELHFSGGSVQGGVKSVDASKNTITVTSKSKDGAKDTTVELLKDAKVIIDDGLGKKGDNPVEGKLSDLKEGISVVVHLSGYDTSKGVGITASGRSHSGTLKGIDVGNRTITVESKGDSGLMETTYTLAKDARVDGSKLEDLSAGMTLSVRTAVLDSKTVTVISVRDK